MNLLPHNLESEEQIVGTLLVDPRCLPRITAAVRPEHFYYEPIGQALRSAMTLDERRQPIDIPSLAEALKDKDFFGVSALSWLRHRADCVVSLEELPSNLRIVRDAADRRALIAFAERARGAAFSMTPLAEIVEQLHADIYSCAAGRHRAFQALGDFSLDVAISVEERAAGNPNGWLPTGYQLLDRAIGGGLYGARLHILAARPGQGKSAFALNLAENLAQSGVPSLIFSLEMSGADLAERALAAEAKIDSQDLRGRRLAKEELARLREAVQRIRALPIWVDDSAVLTLRELRMKARQWHTEVGFAPGLLVIDYLQLMSAETRGRESREREVTEISQGLKALAKEMGLPVLALAQLSRKCEDRKDKRPRLSDLRESGGIEAAADQVWFLYRDETYHRDSADKGTAELLIAKQRGGKFNLMIRLKYQEQFTRFENLSLRPEQGELLT